MYFRNRKKIIFQIIFGIVLIGQCGFSQTPYTWKSVVVGGGGFVPGIIFHPTHQGIVYARTDMGGAYRWDNKQNKWIPLTDMMDRTNADYMGIFSIALDPNDTNRVYMECGKYTQHWAGVGAVLSSLNQGLSWSIVPLPVKIGANEDGRGTGERLQVDPNFGANLFMGTTKDGLWKSTDHGKSWSKVESFHSSNVNFVLFDPASSTAGNTTKRVFIATVNTDGQSLYRTDDGGVTWKTVPEQPTGVMEIRGCIADSILYVTTANHPGPNGATVGSVWKYNISSNSWKNISPSFGMYGFSGISIYKLNSNIITVSTLDRWKPQDEIYLSTDGGTTWRLRLTNAVLDHRSAPYTKGNIKPHWFAALSMDPFDSSKVMFGTGYGIWASDNFISSTPTWYFKDQNLEETVPIQIASSPLGILFSAMGDFDGFRHDSLDHSPADRYFPYKGTTLSITFAEKYPLKLVKAFHSSPFGAYSTDGGIKWIDFENYPAHTNNGGACSIAISADGKTIVWCPPGSSPSYSEDNGMVWKNCSGDVPLAPPVADRTNPEKFYVYDCTKGQLWISTDRARSFYKAAGGLPVWTEWSQLDASITAVPEHDGDIWICCADGGLYHSTDSGHSTLKNPSVTAAYHIGFGKSKNDNQYPAIYLFGIIDGKIGFFRSDNAGQTWIRINDDRHQFGWVHQITGDAKIYGRCYISAEGRGIIYGEIER